MSNSKSLEEIKKFWPKEAPNIKNVFKYVSKYKDELIVIKYGGNVLIDRNGIAYDYILLYCWAGGSYTQILAHFSYYLLDVQVRHD